MFFYKIEENGAVVSVEARSSVSTDEKMTEINTDEYERLREALSPVYAAESVTEGGE